MATPVLSTRGLSKTFRVGMRRKVVHAVSGLDLDVHAGEIFGFLGPNGAGKSTTIKMLMGLIFPTSGSATLFGAPVSDHAARRRIGFLPENPYFPDFLTPVQLLRFAGELTGVPAPVLRDRIPRLIELVGLGRAADMPLRRFSKGMVQRAGIAQALVSDPSLVVLDEPMSGLDPIGRKDVRDVVFRLKEEGKTVFFSSHILPDVEAICDRVALVLGGRLHECGRLEELLAERTRAVDVVAELVPPALSRELEAMAERVVPRGPGLAMTFADEAAADAAIRALAGGGARVVAVSRHRETLEELFMRRADAAASGRPAEPGTSDLRRAG